MNDLRTRFRLGARSLRSAGATFRLFPNYRPLPFPPTGIEGAKEDARQIAGYWRAVGDDLYKGIKKENERIEK